MPNSYVEYSSGLTATTYNIPFNYISIDDVLVKGYNGSAWSDLTVASRDASANTVTLSGAPSAYQKIRVWRNTSTSQLVDFQNGSRLSERDLDTAYQQGLFVSQEVSENASTVVESAGPQGPQGIQGAAGISGVLSDFFESSEQDVEDNAMRIEVEHGLGVVPKLVQAVVRCKQANGGYAVGDELDCSAPTYMNSTKVGFNTFGSLVLTNKATTTTFTPTASKWKVVLRAFA
jgi:hypothetical protein